MAVKRLPVLLNCLLNKMGDVVIHLSTTYPQNVLLNLALTAPWFTDTHPQSVLRLVFLGILWFIPLWSCYSVIEFMNQSQFLLNNFTELFWIVRAWDGLCEFGRLSLFKILNWNQYLNNFAKALQFFLIAEIVSKTVKLEVCQFFAITVSNSKAVKLIHF